MAVLAALYFQPLPEVLAGRRPTQLLHAVLLSDMWQIPDITAAAVQALVDALGSTDSFSWGRLQPEDDSDGTSILSVVRAMLQQAVSPCLLPVFSVLLAACTAGVRRLQEASTRTIKPAAGVASLKAAIKQLLLSVLGDLEAVWADAELRKTLLALPPSAMATLLSLDNLKVSCEDTVLYTAITYVNKLTPARLLCAGTNLEQVMQDLAELVRCPWLSPFWIGAAALLGVEDDNTSLPTQLLEPHHYRLKVLHMMMLAEPALMLLASDTAKLQEVFSALPPEPTPLSKSWLRWPRVYGPAVNSVSTTWVVDVSRIKEAAVSAAAAAPAPALNHGRAVLVSDTTPPLSGLAWTLGIEAFPGERAFLVSESGDHTGVSTSKLSLYAACKNAPPGVFFNCEFSVSVGDAVLCELPDSLRPCSQRHSWSDAFGVGFMPGGWDDSMWAAKGMPSSGSLVLSLTVSRGD